LRDVELVDLIPLGAVGVLRARFCGGGAGFLSVFILIRFFTRTFRFPAVLYCR